MRSSIHHKSTGIYPMLLLFVSCLVLTVNGIATRNASIPVADLGYVKYTPAYNATSEIFYYRGIPYAQPPTGEMRWKAPQPIEAKNSFNGSKIAADTIGVSCVQNVPYWYLTEYGALPDILNVPHSEDCLLMDILVPSNAVDKQLPVVVQIHGGGYTYGWAQLYPGDSFVHQSKGTVIYVSIQYRLGAFGFLAGDEIAANATRNVGLLDQRAALEWLQRNVAAFGGDPSKITILGGSAGGGSVSFQLTGYGGTGTPPFRAAIPEYPWWQPLKTERQANRQYDLLLHKANCTDLPCLRSLSTERLSKAVTATYKLAFPGPEYPTGEYYYGPVIDGDFVRDLPSQEFKHGHFYKVPALIDHDSDEGSVFTAPLASSEAASQDERNIFPDQTPAFRKHLLDNLYPLPLYLGNETIRRSQIFGDAVVICPTLYMAQAMTNSNRNTSAVFKMIWGAGGGVHSSDYYFISNADINWSGADPVGLAPILTDYFISFVRFLDPNPGRQAGTPFWPSYNADEDGQVLYITSLHSIEVNPDVDQNARCRFYQANSQIVQN